MTPQVQTPCLTVQETLQSIKRHWNSVTLDGTVPQDVIADMIAQSYTLVFDSLPRAARLALTQTP